MERMVESKMIQEINVCYAYKTKNIDNLNACKELLQQVIINIFSSTVKIKNVDDIYKADFIIGDPAHPDFKHNIDEKIRIRSLASIILLVNEKLRFYKDRRSFCIVSIQFNESFY